MIQGETEIKPHSWLLSVRLTNGQYLWQRERERARERERDIERASVRRDLATGWWVV